MILITGANGFVGRQLMEALPDALACPSLQNKTAEQVKAILDASAAEVVIHTAAISDTGLCQQNPQASYQANVVLPQWLAQGAKGRKLICFSSDQVYNAAPEPGPYREDMACPGSVYAAHKLEMEQRVLDIAPSAVILRAQWIYDYSLSRPNYLMNLLHAQEGLSFSPQQFRGLCYRKEIAEAMPQVLSLPGGVYNFGSETTQSIYAITREILDFLGKDVPLVPGPPRHNLWMDCQKAQRQGIQFSPVAEGLKRCLRDHGLVR